MLNWHDAIDDGGNKIPEQADFDSSQKLLAMVFATLISRPDLRHFKP